MSHVVFFLVLLLHSFILFALRISKSFAKRIGESKLTQAQSDKLQDTKDTSELHTPEEIDKSITHEDMDSFIHTLLIYGSCLKNLELLPKKEKEIMYNCSICSNIKLSKLQFY